RLGALGTRCLAGDHRYFGSMGGAARAIRLGRHRADLYCRPVPRLAASPERIDAPDLRAACRVQFRRHAGDRGAVEVFRCALKHDPEKWMPVFRKRSCSAKILERQSIQLETIAL